MNSQDFPTIAYTNVESDKTEVGFKKTIPLMWYIQKFSADKWMLGSAVNGPVFKMYPFSQSSWMIKIEKKCHDRQLILSATVSKLTPCEITSKFTLIWIVKSRKCKKFLKKKVIVEGRETYQDIFDIGIYNFIDSKIYFETINMMIQIEIDCSVMQQTTTNDATFDRNVSCIRSSLDKGGLKVLRDMESILKEAVFSDVTLRAQGKEIRTHRNILSGRSSVFKSMLEHPMSENASGVVDISDISYATLQKLMTYLYSGRLDELTVKSASDLFVASDKYAVEDLHGTCSLFLKSNMTVDNCLEILMLADLHSNADLKSFAVVFFSGNSKEISLKPGWDDGLKVRPDVYSELFTVLAAK